MLNKVLIANRGAIACRILRTLKKMGIASVAIYSEADAGARHVLEADEAWCVGPASAAESYLNAARILEIALETGAQAIHPGYGFLSENAEFAERCEQAGIVFIGPTAAQMRAFGLKHTARALAEQLGVPLLPGSGLLTDLAQATVEAAQIGYPVMLKSTAGGGGIGMQLIHDAETLPAAYASVERLAKANFKAGGLYLEKFVAAARHIEVQIVGDGQGGVVSLGERDCSLQRRNQKVIEETPAPNISDTVRTALANTARKLAQAVQYRSAGTVEFVYDCATEQFYFLEVNTRLQVEHGVTELVCNVDLVEWMLRIAAGETSFLQQYQHQPQGHAIQARIYAEDANKQFQPCCGQLTEVHFPADLRVDSWVVRGSEVTPYYDPMLAKLLVHADDREKALDALRRGLSETRLYGIETNLAYLRAILQDPVFPSGQHTTRSLGQFQFQPNTIDVLDGGVMTTLQDFPGRIGYWHIGVPPSGPMDDVSFRLANRLVGNPPGMVALESTLIGPCLKFNQAALIAVTGPDVALTLENTDQIGKPLALWQAHYIAAGSVLRLGKIVDAGCRNYLAIRGGFDVPDYLGSKSTFTLGQFGGHAGRALRTGDVLPMAAVLVKDHSTSASEPLPPACRPVFSRRWEIGVLVGPHGAPDFFTAADMDMFFSTDWEVHYNSNTTGIRLIGPKPEWARRDGGEAGLHPSNIHDNAYAIGSIDFTGDMPVILGPDGPSLGGFVCPATIVQAELWKMGQLKAGDKVRFKPLSQSQAQVLLDNQDKLIQAPISANNIVSDMPLPAQAAAEAFNPILAQRTVKTMVDTLPVVYRQAGDQYLLVEYGALVLDLRLRLRVHALMEWIQAERIPGIIDVTPGIRSLQIHFDSRTLPCQRLLSLLEQAEQCLPDLEHMAIPSRVVHLPLSWNDAATQLAVEKYLQSVRKNAPWCEVSADGANNIEFIRRINGLNSIEAVRDIVFNASYLTLGLGDVYLGAPVATPLDPRHRLVTTKYNPARTWTPENAVGIGGAYMCIYGMEGPGGYQFVGRTLQMWHRWAGFDDHGQLTSREQGTPWLLRFFDQIRFYPVTADELLQIRADFPRGKYRVQVAQDMFKLHDYTAFLQREATSIQAFKNQQQAAFEAERASWIAQGQMDDSDTDQAAVLQDTSAVLASNQYAVNAHVAGNIWQIRVKEGDHVEAGQDLLVVESMKMEIAIPAPRAGKVASILCQTGSSVSTGQRLLVIEIPEMEA